jgi:hypothetical protein
MSKRTLFAQLESQTSIKPLFVILSLVKLTFQMRNFLKKLCRTTVNFVILLSTFLSHRTFFNQL